MDISGIILAGGKSSRMGKNKALMEIGGVAMIERVALVVSRVCSEIIIAGGSNYVGHLGHLTVPDTYTGCGPLCGLHAGLSAAKNRYCFITACDIPFLDERLMEKIIMEVEDGYDAVVLRVGKYFEPLFSIYSRDYAGAAEHCIKRGNFKVTAPLSLVRWKSIVIDPSDLPGLEKSLMNINTPKDYEEAKKINK